MGGARRNAWPEAQFVSASHWRCLASDGHRAVEQPRSRASEHRARAGPTVSLPWCRARRAISLIIEAPRWDVRRHVVRVLQLFRIARKRTTSTAIQSRNSMHWL